MKSPRRGYGRADTARGRNSSRAHQTPLGDAARTCLPAARDRAQAVAGSIRTSGRVLDGVAILLEAADRQLGMIAAVAESFTDQRDGSRVKHDIEELLSQRIFGLARGY